MGDVEGDPAGGRDDPDAGSSQADTAGEVTLEIDADVLDRFRADGPGWQGRTDEALRKAVGLG